jgi:hypothetical protein
LHKYFSAWAGYINDTWRLRPGLTLTLGLRYEYTTRFHADPPMYMLPVIANGEFTGKLAIARTGDGKLSPASIPSVPAQIPGSLVGCKDVGLSANNCLISEKKIFSRGSEWLGGWARKPLSAAAPGSSTATSTATPTPKMASAFRS